MNPESRSDKVSLKYEIGTGLLHKTIELPFTIGVLADFAGDNFMHLPVLNSRAFEAVTSESLNAFMARCAPALRLAVGADTVDLEFRKLSDFGPEGVARQIPGLTEALVAQTPEASDRLDTILHSPAFQSLEARWRGLKYLLNWADPSHGIKVMALCVTKDELRDDMLRRRDSAIFRKICIEPYAVPECDPYAVLVGDYEFSGTDADLDLLEGLAGVCASANTPFLSAAGPEMFGWENFGEFPREPSSLFEKQSYARWRSLRDSEDARYAALVLPRMLMRLPYGSGTFPVRAFPYEEGVGDDDHARLLWGNSVYALAGVLAGAFRRYRWCAAITGVERGGLVEFLPLHRHKRSCDGREFFSSLETAIDEMAGKELCNCGFIPFQSCLDSELGVFFSAASLRRPAVAAEAAPGPERLLCELPHILAGTRFAHYLKAIVCGRSESFRHREECASALNARMSQYVDPEQINGPEAWIGRSAEFPLLAAHLEVDEIPAHSGRFIARVQLRAFYQLQDAGVPQRIIVELPPPAVLPGQSTCAPIQPT